ncbi:hypothetical protein MNBD_GAMMA20-500 [hydrothermal vent metagenome]|uniref:Uncharacterized protein n=1 Tax=hydrothermal vent metagenome TaxID=652676 RepID=A0A3B1ALT8_9ZZZZ
MTDSWPLSEEIKQREIRFCTLDPSAEPARDAAQLLLNAPGVETVQALTRDNLHIHYRLCQISLQIIEESLVELGFHLDNSLLCRMRRALIYYCEETELANMGRSHDKTNATLDIFINSYQQRRHDCRDPHPKHLRNHS